MLFLIYIISFILGLLFGVIVHIHYKKQEKLVLIQKIFNFLEAMTAITLFLIILTRGQYLLYIYGTGVDIVLCFFLGTLLAASLGNSILI